jgi:hypothetical protein
MKKSIILFLFCGIAAMQCKKEQAEVAPKNDNLQLQIDLGEEVIDDAQKNNHSVYSFGGILGLYYGCSSVFKIDDNQSLEITIGTAITKNSEVQDADLLLAIRPGERTFGSLGAFSSYPEMYPGKAEISFTDKKSRRWCSTRITEKHINGDIEANTEAEQPDGKFFIDDVNRTVLDNGNPGYRIKGHFDCFLYEVNGKARKKIKGNFRAVVSVFE